MYNRQQTYVDFFYIYRIESINGTAKEGEDYIKVKEIVEFQENEEEKDVRII